MESQTADILTFVSAIAKEMSLDNHDIKVLADSAGSIEKLAIQRGRPSGYATRLLWQFYRTLYENKGKAFKPRITRKSLSDGTEIICIEPPCGCNIFILHSGYGLLFIDSGYACYAQEVNALLAELIPDFERLPRQMILTHPDDDHCGLHGMFDTIYTSYEAQYSFELERCGLPGLREKDPQNAPYVRISRILSGYHAPFPDHIRVIGSKPDSRLPLSPAGNLTIAGRRFDIYHGNGGHSPGEMVIVDKTDKLIFCGDILINQNGFTPRQRAFNRLAPELMRNVNTDFSLLIKERHELLNRFPSNQYTYCTGHGAIMMAGR